MHCVTMGPKASEAARALFEKNQYQDYLYLHGLGVRDRRGSGRVLAQADAPRNWASPARTPPASRTSSPSTTAARATASGIPHARICPTRTSSLACLEPERIGCTLTENWQIDPEQSTSAIIVHHPEAKYFNV
jgi:5-methyltetrahydrofolate--homocysteine methyltransferase